MDQQIRNGLYPGLLRLPVLMALGIFFLTATINAVNINRVYPQDYCLQYTDEQILDAIYKAEGSEKAKKPFGILSVPCDDYESCRIICLNTIKNNRKRYVQWGYKKYPDYLSFLASRYCPVGAKNDPSGLNKNWLNNVKYFLGKNTLNDIKKR